MDEEDRLVAILWTPAGTTGFLRVFIFADTPAFSAQPTPTYLLEPEKPVPVPVQ
jgi:hypothetical protein